MNDITFFYFSAIVGGMAFITYHKPEHSRKLLINALGIITILLILFANYYTSRVDSYEKMKNKTIEIISTQNIENKSEIINQINLSCNEMTDEVGNNLRPYVKYVIWLFPAVLVLFFLSFWFEKMINDKTNKTPNSTV